MNMTNEQMEAFVNNLSHQDIMNMIANNPQLQTDIINRAINAQDGTNDGADGFMQSDEYKQARQAYLNSDEFKLYKDDETTGVPLPDGCEAWNAEDLESEEDLDDESAMYEKARQALKAKNKRASPSTTGGGGKRRKKATEDPDEAKCMGGRCNGGINGGYMCAVCKWRMSKLMATFKDDALMEMMEGSTNDDASSSEEDDDDVSSDESDSEDSDDESDSE